MDSRYSVTHAQILELKQTALTLQFLDEGPDLVEVHWSSLLP
jgi:hypothetical protein